MGSDSNFTVSWDDVSEVNASYSHLCVTALLSAILGAGTFLVYLTPWFSFIGIAAILLSFVAFYRISRAEGILVGTPFAYFGLCCAIMVLISVAVFWGVYQRGVRQEADQFFRIWFAAALRGDIPQLKGYQAIYAYRSQVQSADDWWKAQYRDRTLHQEIHQFTSNGLVRVLMALGSKAQVTYYKTLSFRSERDADVIESLYAVSFPAESGEIQTLFVKINGERCYPARHIDSQAAGWFIPIPPLLFFPEELAACNP